MDFPEIKSKDQLEELFNKEAFNKRSIVTRSFIRFIEEQDAYLVRKKVIKRSTATERRITIIKRLQSMLTKHKGYQNIMFVTKDNIKEELFKKKCLTDHAMREKLRLFEANGWLRFYTKADGIQGDMFKLCINPSFGYRWYKGDLVYVVDHKLKEDRYYSFSYGTNKTLDDLIKEGRSLTPLQPSIFKYMNRAKQSWAESVTRLSDTNTRLVGDVSAALGLPVTLDADGLPYVKVVESQKHKEWIASCYNN
jgi:hypothetical protein